MLTGCIFYDSIIDDDFDYLMAVIYENDLSDLIIQSYRGRNM
jgi:hypothetical protein